MRTRIKVIEKNNGNKKYQPQVKDKFTIFDALLFLPCVIFFGKSTWRYLGLNTYEQNNDLFMLHPLNVHPGVCSEEGDIHTIEQCNTKEGIEFTTLEEAKIYLEKYIQQERGKLRKIEKKADEIMSGITKKEYYIEKTNLKEI